MNQGRYEEAEPLFVEAVETGRRVFGDEYERTLQSMGNLAYLYTVQGRYEEAEPLLLEAHESWKRVFGGEHPRTLESTTQLVALYLYQGRYEEAETLQLENFETAKRVLRDDHPTVQNALYWLGCIEALRGDEERAMDWLGQSVEAGFADADSMAKDSNLSSLHGPAFDALVERARQNRSASQGSQGRSEKN